MSLHEITERATGRHRGYYEAATAREALDAMGRDNQGYGGFAEWSEASGERASDLVVRANAVRPDFGAWLGERAG